VKPLKFTFLSILTGIVLSALAILATLVIFKTAEGTPEYSWGASIAGVLVAMVSGIFAYYIIYRSLKKDTKIFVQALFAGMGGKLLIGLASILLLAMVNRRVINEYVIVFFASYFIFTAFEVYGLMRNLRPENTKASEIAKDTKVSGKNES
jgi:drug/metabolite transporter (DMT)-like permease